MKMQPPKVVRWPDGSLTGHACMVICRYYAEEAEWNNEDSTYWRQQENDYRKGVELGLKSWVSHPAIERKLKEDAELWKKSWVSWEQRQSLSVW